MADPILKFGNDIWAVRGGTEIDRGAALAYDDQNSQFKSIPIAHKRKSGGSYVDRDGLIKYAEMNEPRVDFLNNTKGHLLLEVERTNSAKYSEDFTGWSITASGTTLTSNSAISPDGNQTADLLESDGTNAFARVFQSVSLTSGNNCFYSVFVKKSGSHDFASIRVAGTNVGGSGQTGSNYTFTFSTETLSNDGGGTATSTLVENYGNGWYRIGIEMANSTITEIVIYPKFNSSVAGEVLIWGAQLEVGSYQTSYIPTDSYAVSRINDDSIRSANADILEGCNTEGVLYVEIAALFDDLTQRRIAISDGSYNNRIVVGYNTISNRIFYFVIVGGATIASGSYDTTDVTDFHKVAIKWKANDFAMWVDGVERHTDTSGGVYSSGTLNTFRFANAVGSQEFYGKVKEAKIFDLALSDSELQTLTS